MKMAQLVLTGIAVIFSTTALANTVVTNVGQSTHGQNTVTTIDAKYVSCAQYSEKDFEVRLIDESREALVLDVDVASDVGDCGDFPSVKTIELRSAALPRLDQVLVKDWSGQYLPLSVRHEMRFDVAPSKSAIFVGCAHVARQLVNGQVVCRKAEAEDDVEPERRCFAPLHAS